MKKIEYLVREKEFTPTGKVIFEVWLQSNGLESWELINIVPLQTITSTISVPGNTVIKTTFLCVFKRKQSWFTRLKTLLSKQIQG